MPFSFRLDRQTAAKIRRLATATGRTQSNVVREAIARYDAGEESAEANAEPSALDRLRPYVGIVTTAGANYSQDTHAKYRREVQKKHNVRRPR